MIYHTAFFNAQSSEVASILKFTPALYLCSLQQPSAVVRQLYGTHQRNRGVLPYFFYSSIRARQEEGTHTHTHTHTHKTDPEIVCTQRRVCSRDPPWWSEECCFFVAYPRATSMLDGLLPPSPIMQFSIVVGYCPYHKPFSYYH